MSFVTHLECSKTGARLPVGEPTGLSPDGWPVLVRYDLGAIGAAVDRDALVGDGMWRYAALLPMRDESSIVSLGEVTTPLIPVGDGQVFFKDEGRLPTGSFKARGVAVAVSMAVELGIDYMAMSSNGNAGSALAAYATRAGIRSAVMCPADTPPINVAEITAQGAEIRLIDGFIDECGQIVRDEAAERGWFDCSTLREPYRIEGKKTMGLELAEQFGWSLPDVVLYPTGGGTGLIGMWKVFGELRELGWIEGPLPRMVAVQAAGCAPIVRAWQQGTEHAAKWEDAATVAAGIRVPAAIGDFLMLRAIRESEGFGIAVDDAAIVAARDRLAAEDGLLVCPEGAATYAAYHAALAEGLLDGSESAVLFNCATGLKYPL